MGGASVVPAVKIEPEMQCTLSPSLCDCLYDCLPLGDYNEGCCACTVYYSHNCRVSLPNGCKETDGDNKGHDQEVMEWVRPDDSLEGNKGDLDSMKGLVLIDYLANATMTLKVLLLCGNLRILVAPSGGG